MSIKLNRPVGYAVKSVFQVIESGLRSGHWGVGQHAFAILYLWAYGTYRPVVSDKHRKWLKDYAHKVKHTVEAQQSSQEPLKYRRYVGYDEAIELLFPELADELQSQFGVVL